MQPQNSPLPLPKPYSKPEVRAVVLVPGDYVLASCQTASDTTPLAICGFSTDCLYEAVQPG